MLNIGQFARLGHVSPRMLRHYDEIGLLRPDRVNPANGYRLYGVHQLRRLHRLLALRDLGFTLEQVRDVLDEDPPTEQVRGMLRMRRAQIEQDVAEHQARLRRIEAHLRALEGTTRVNPSDFVIKQTQPVRIAETTGAAPSFGPENIAPVFDRKLPDVWAHLHNAGVQPGITVAYYDWPADDGSVVVHLGFEIADQQIPETADIRVVELPVTKVATTVHRGP
ncbi:MAG TPA: helix-turn-helix domain-containing protein, partial [Frankiaceae bacterium]|nr:helix-turn-helix domain-containing protein [Frankiaceae bacterium]